MPKVKRRCSNVRSAAMKRWQTSQEPSQPATATPTDNDEVSLTQAHSTSAASQPSTSRGLSSIPTSMDSSDSDLDPEEALLKDPDALLEDFVNKWVSTLSRDDLYSLSLLLFYILQQECQYMIGPASKIIARHLKKNNKTVQEWRVNFIKNNGQLPQFQKGKYHRVHAIANNEELTKEATKYVRENSFKPGAPNLTSHSFCTWVNTKLLPNSTLEAGAPRKISSEVARRWLLEMGFKVRKITKGIYYDGHKRADVLEDRKQFLSDVSALGFLHTSNAQSEDAGELLNDVTLRNNWENTIFWFHDESTFNANDDQTSMWKDSTMQVIKPKGRGAGLMVSDFIEERDGFCALSNEMFETLFSNADPTLPQSARVIFEYGKAKEGYWDNAKFLEQIETAAKVAEAKYPPRIFDHVWIFDHSCGHTAYADDALVASRLGKKPGGEQPRMRDTTWAGKPQKLVMADGKLKGAALILEERGVNTASLTLADMKIIFSCHDDFKHEKSALHQNLKDTLSCFCLNSTVN